MTAGTSTIRTSGGVDQHRHRQAEADLLDRATFAASTKDRNTTTMIAAAAVITRAVRASPRATDAALSPVAS